MVFTPSIIASSNALQYLGGKSVVRFFTLFHAQLEVTDGCDVLDIGTGAR